MDNNRLRLMRRSLPDSESCRPPIGDLYVNIPKDLRRPPTEQPLRQPLGTRYLTRPQYDARQPALPHVKKHHRRAPASVNDVPSIIFDSKRKEYYTKLDYLGEGGFAQCYKVKDTKGHFYAAKVISKASVQDKKNRDKLFAEVNVHRAMNHKNIVRFHVCFEDDHNVYLILELCENKTLVELLRERGRLTEPEVRYFLYQILEACKYMHRNRVIHRDIKLSNIFLDKNMDVKVGDFGLAALLVDPQERKKTICGTPNYIAPEILFEKKNGHDYKVDLWSIGVLMYTLLVGQHPFQQDQVKNIYRKIRENSQAPSYRFPENVDISEEAKDLISKLLVNKPELRLPIPDILTHPFFENGKATSSNPSPLASHTRSNKSSDMDAQKENSPSSPRKRRFPFEDCDTNKRRETHEEKNVEPSGKTPVARPPVQRQNPVSVLETMAKVLRETLDDKTSYGHGGPISDKDIRWTADNVFLDKWVDFSSKYGLAYRLSDGTHGALFNDATSMITQDDKTYYYIMHGHPPKKEIYHISSIPQELKKKVHLMNNFKEYMEEHLLEMADNLPDLRFITECTYLSKYIATEKAVVFRLTNDVIQFNFYNHMKLILTEFATKVIYITPERRMEFYLLVDAASSKDKGLREALAYARETLEEQVRARYNRK